MKRKERFFVAGIIVFFLITLMASSSPAQSVRGVTESTIQVGAIWDMTGPVAGIMIPIVDGIRTYTRYVNDQGGINGRKIKLILEDDRYSIPMAVAAFKKLLFRDKIFTLLGPGSSGETAVLMRHIMEQKLPAFPLAADTEVVDPYKRYLFLAIDTYDNQTGVLLDWMVQESKPKKARIACIVLDIGAKVQFLRAVKKWSKFFDLDVPVVMTVLGALDLTSEILLLKKEKPDYVIPFLTTDAIVALLRDSKKLGLDSNVYATYSGTGEDVVNGAKKLANKFFGVHFYSSWYDDTPGMAEMRKITLQYYPGTEKPYRPKNYTIGWMMATLLYEGIKRAGKDLDNEKLIDALETFKNFDTKGIGGSITYTSKNHAGITYDKIYKGDPATGKLIPISDWRKAPEIK
ncbi:MAG: ABC transporter substrate-binding protein [Thermodesulfobacteriota bacterium]